MSSRVVVSRGGSVDVRWYLLDSLRKMTLFVEKRKKRSNSLVLLYCDHAACGFDARAPVLAMATERCTLGHCIRCTIGHYSLFFLWVLFILRMCRSTLKFSFAYCLPVIRLNLKRLYHYVAALLLLSHQRLCRHIWKWNECNKKSFHLKAIYAAGY